MKMIKDLLKEGINEKVPLIIGQIWPIRFL